MEPPRPRDGLRGVLASNMHYYRSGRILLFFSECERAHDALSQDTLTDSEIEFESRRRRPRSMRHRPLQYTTDESVDIAVYSLSCVGTIRLPCGCNYLLLVGENDLYNIHTRRVLLL